MKLESEHLTPYSPYRLRCKLHDKTEATLMGVEQGYASSVQLGLFNEFGAYELDKVKPILRDPSEFSGNLPCSDIMKELDCDSANVYEIWDLANGDISFEDVSYGTILVMCKNHIDFQGLLKAGLAIKKPTT